jgi:hypothetical protein
MFMILKYIRLSKTYADLILLGVIVLCTFEVCFRRFRDSYYLQHQDKVI